MLVSNAKYRILSVNPRVQINSINDLQLDNSI